MSKSLRTLMAAALLLAAGNLTAAVITIDAVPGGGLDAGLVTTPGATFSVAVRLGDVTDLAGFEFRLGFDPGILVATGVHSGDLFGLDTLPVTATIGSGLVTFAEASFGPGLDLLSDTLIATLDFTALAAGTTALGLTGVILSDGLGNAIAGLQVAGAEVQVMPAPLPGTALLLGLGLFGLVRRSGR